MQEKQEIKGMQQKLNEMHEKAEEKRCGSGEEAASSRSAKMRHAIPVQKYAGKTCHKNNRK